MTLFLVRHGRPLVDRSRPAAEWELDPAEGILAEHPDTDVVLVGHGTAWTALAAVLTGEEADLDRWHALQMPDLAVVDGLPSKG